jgi:hypothetical protein
MLISGSWRSNHAIVPGIVLPAGMKYDNIPDVRDGLTRKERIVLYVLHETQKERGGRDVPTVMLWGRVCEHFYISPEDLSEMLARLGARRF